MKRINTKLKMIMNILKIIINKLSVINTIAFTICFTSCITLVLFSPVLPHDLVSKSLHIIVCCATISGIILIVQYWKN